MAKIKNYSLEGMKGTKLTVIARWKFGDMAHLKQFKIRWDYKTKKNGWIAGSESSVSICESTFNVPDNASITAVRCRVKPESTTYQVDEPTGEKNKDGTDKTRKATRNHFDGTWVTPGGSLPANVKSTLSADARAKAAAEKKALAQYNAAAANANAARLEYEIAVNRPGLADKDRSSRATKAKKLYEKAADQYGKAASYYGDAGKSGKKATCEKRKKSCAGKAEKAAAKATLATSEHYRKYYAGLAEAQASAAGKDASSAAACRKSKAYGKAASYERSAASKYDQAATEYGRAKSHSSTSKQESAYEDSATKAKGLKSKCEERAKDDESKQADAEKLAAEMSAAPAEVSDLKVSRSGAKFTVTCKCPAKWARFVQFQVQVGGKWQSWSGSTVSKKTGNASAVAVSATYQGSVGKVYRFRARSVLADKSTASAWTYSDYARTAPAAGKNLRVAATASGAVTVEWENVGDGRESIELQYSTYYNPATKRNAWADGATAEIKTVKLGANAARHTVTGLDGGTKVYVRVKAVNSSGSAWTTVKGNAKSTTVSATPPRQAATLSALTGLKAVLLADNRTVRVTFSGAVEDGASVRVEHTATAGAFGNNVADAIESEGYEPASASAKSHALGISSLDQGKTHWFRVTKTKGGASAVRAKCASGEWRESDYVAKVAVPAASSAITAPSGLALSSPYEGAVRCEWADECKSGESYELQYTANAQAFADNAAGDITSTAYGEPAVGASRHVFTLTGLEPGTSYWVRVRKKDGDGASAWSGVAEATLAPPSSSDEGLRAPAASPTSMAYATSERPVLSWVHSAEQESAQSAFQVLISAVPPEPAARYVAASDAEVDPAKVYYVEDGDGFAEVEEPVAGDLGGYFVLVEGRQGEAEETTVSGGADNAVELDLSGYAGGTQVTWMVRTQGALEGVWSPWSAAQVFAVVDPPSAGVSLSDAAGAAVDASAPLSRLPLALSVELGGMASNPPVELHLEIVAAEGHEAVGDDGSQGFVPAGEAVYSRYFTPSDGLAAGTFEAAVPASEVRLDSGQPYIARAAVSTAFGVRAESDPVPFSCQWSAELPDPVAAAEWDGDALTATIMPACYEAVESEAPEEEVVAATAEIAVPSLPHSEQMPVGTVSVEDVGATAAGEDGEDDDVPVEWSFDAATRTLLLSSAGGDGELSVAVSYVQLVGAEAEPEADAEAEPEADAEPGVGGSVTSEQAAMIAEVGAAEAEEDMGDFADVTAAAEEMEAGGEDYGTLLDGVTLDVYRVNFDGEAIPIATGLPNDGQASCTDPHPPFGTAEYRVVAHDSATDSQSVATVSLGTPVSRVVLTTPWGDVHMPYGLSLDEEHSVDSEAVAFSGRRKKVAFFGEGVATAVSQSATVAAQLSDGEVSMLRRLGHAPTLAYLRDPSGLAFWAVARVRMSHPSAEVTEVSLDYEMVDAPEGEVG